MNIIFTEMKKDPIVPFLVSTGLGLAVRALSRRRKGDVPFSRNMWKRRAADYPPEELYVINKK